jgi:tRNA-specific 2-thiouridylase
MLMQDAGMAGTDDARAVADTLGMEFSVLDVREQFKKEVMDEFIASYLRGETPNPCVDCNNHHRHD